MQSPIDLNLLEATKDSDIAIKVQGYMGATKQPLEKGQRMETNFDVELRDQDWVSTATLMRTNSEGVTQIFTPDAIHIHTPSEHTINGRLSDAEIHLVHVGENGNLSVIGIFLDRYAGSYDNRFIESVFDAFATRNEDEDWKEEADLTKLFTDDLDL